VISGLQVTNCLHDSASAGLKVHAGFTGFQGLNILATGNTGAGLHITGGNSTLTTCTATDNVWGIRLDYSDNHTLTGCVASNNQRQDAITGNYGQGIRIISVNSSSLSSCQANQNAESGILVSKDTGTTSDISMTGCTSNNNGTIVPANGYGVFVTNSSSVSFSGGTITGNQAWGGFRDTSSTATGLSSSAVSSNGSGNVHLQLSINTRIEGNNIGTSSTDSVELLDTQGVKILGNTISGALNGTDNIHAIKLRGNILGADNTTIAGNTLSENRNGIRLEGASAFNLIENNHILDNTYIGLVIAPDMSGDQNTIRGNEISNNDRAGIQANSGGNLIYNNIFDNGRNNNYSSATNNTWAVTPTAGINIIGGPLTAGNFWSDYTGTDRGDGIGTTPYTNGNISDPYPLVVPEPTTTLLIGLAGALMAAHAFRRKKPSLG